MGFLGDHSFVVPKNVSQMATFCQQLKDSIGCIQSYSRDCLATFTRQLLTSLLKRGKQQYSQICNNDQTKANFITRMSCLSDQKINQFHNCMDASIARFEYIASDKVDKSNKLLSLCCSYQIFSRDVDQTLSKICGQPKQVAGSINDFVSRIVSGTAGEFFGLICDNHRTLDECQKSTKTSSLVPKLEQITEQVHKGQLRAKNKSLLPVLLDVLAYSN